MLGIAQPLEHMRLSTSASNVEVSTKAAQLHCTEHDCLSGALTLARMLCPDAVAQALANRAAVDTNRTILWHQIADARCADATSAHLPPGRPPGILVISRSYLRFPMRFGS